jgi:zinc transporter ZupT
MSTVTNVSGFLAGFSLATAVVIADAPEHFRLCVPRISSAALTSSVALVAARP